MRGMEAVKRLGAPGVLHSPHSLFPSFPAKYTTLSRSPPHHRAALSTGATPSRQSGRMDIPADELLEELARIETTLDEAARRAGDGCPPDFERRLEAHLRSLRSMLGPADIAVASDAMEAAERAMNADRKS